MFASVRRSLPRLFAACCLVPSLHAFPLPVQVTGEESESEEEGSACLHSSGYAGLSSKARKPPARKGGAPHGDLAIGVCAVDNARGNGPTPVKTNGDFVPITGDDSLGFYCVYGVRASATGTVAGNVCIYIFELAGGEVLLFGSGYGNIPGANLFDAAYDMERVDQVIRYCMGKDPATTPLRIVAPHGHLDHINPACNRELERLGYRVLEIAFHPGDLTAISAMGWTTADRNLFRVLPTSAQCLGEIATYASPLGKIWFFERPGHTPGSIDLVIDTRNDPTNRFLVRGSQASSLCAPLSGLREASNAHGNVELLAIPPTLTDVAPLAGTPLGGTTLTLTGSNFTVDGAGTHVVLVNGVPASDVVVVSDTTLTCRTPAGPPAQLVEVAVVNNNGKAVYPGTYFYYAQPTLTSISPTSGTWRGNTLVQVRGSGYTLASGVNEVYFGASKATAVTVLGDGLLTCRTPIGTPATNVDVEVRNPNGQAKLVGVYRYNSDLSITSVSPADGTTLGGTAVVLTGTAFTGNGSTPTVTFGGVPATSVVLLSSTSVSCVTPAGVPGATVSVALTNSAGTTSFTGFRYHAAPTATAVTPAIGTALGNTLVTVTGTGFSVDGPGTNQVRIGGALASSVTVLSNTSLTCRTPAGPAGNQVNLTVTNLNGTATLPLAFTYAQALTGQSLAPLSGTSLGGTLVTITGSGFLDGPAGPTSVRFGGVPATGISVQDDRTLRCLAPAGAPGARVDIALSNSNGSATMPLAYRYHGLPTLTAASPDHGHASASTPVTLTGTGFLDDDAGLGLVVVGGIAASDVEVTSDSSLTCLFPPGTAGATVDVLLINQNGTATLVRGFRYHGMPTLTASTPNAGSSIGRPSVTLTGTGFLNDQAGTNTVTFGTSPATNVTVLGDTSLRCNAPVGSAGQQVAVTVSNARGSVTLASAFRFYPRPSLSALSVQRGTPFGNTSVTLTGTGFLANAAGTNTVTFGGIPATGVVVLGDTSLQCKSPPGAASAVVDVVVSNANGSATLARAFSYSVLPPTLTGLTPGSGPAHNPGSIQLTGSGFVADSPGTNSVTFGGVASGIVGVLDDGTLSCQVPPGVAGTRIDISLSNANGTTVLPLAFRYHARPALTAVTPAGATSLGGGTVELSGSGFQVDAAGQNSVTFGGVPATAVTLLGDGTLSCGVPPGTAGTSVDVVVTNGNGQSDVLPLQMYPWPALASVAPDSGPATGGTQITLTGSGFLANTPGPNEVLVAGKPALGVLVVSDSLLTCFTPRGTSGFNYVQLANENGMSRLENAFHYGKLPPAISSVEPPHGPTAGQNLVTIKGSGFLGGTNRVKFGETESTNVFTVDDQTVLCAVPAGAPGLSVDVALSTGKSTVTLGDGYRYHARPVLLAIDPPAGDPLGQTRVRLTGSGFLSDNAGENTVLIGNVRARNVRVQDDQHLTCSPVGGTPGASLDVMLRNANGSVTLPQAYHIVGGPPAVTDVRPRSGSYLGGTQVVLTGSGFQAGSLVVVFGKGRATGVVVLDDTRLTCVTPPGTVRESVSVTVQTVNGIGGMLGAYTYQPLPPVIAAVAPNHGTASGGTNVTVTGQNFQAAGAGATVVTFGGAPAGSVVVVDDSTLTCAVPPGTPGASVTLSVQNANGSASLADAFQYHPPPTLASVTPARSPAAGGTVVTLTGSGFLAVEADVNLVLFGGVAAQDVLELDDATLICTTPPGTPGTTVDVTLVNGNGVALLPGGFSYHGVTTLTSVSPDHGPAAGATTVTLTGTGFQADEAGTNTVLFGASPATNVVVASDTTLICRAPAGSAGQSVAVSVSNANGSASLPAAYRYNPVPTLTSVAPARGPAAGGTTVTVTGSGFLNDEPGINRVLLGSFAATNVTVQSDTTLTCTSPAGTPTAQVTVTLANANGSATSSNAFRYNPLPTLTRVAPASGPAPGGSLVTLTGTGFSLGTPGTNTVLFGGTPATAVAVQSDTTLTCSAPAGTAGAAVNVSVGNSNGTATLVGGYRYNLAPTLASVAPVHGSALGGTSLTLTGTGFADPQAGATQVTIGGAAATAVVVVDNTRVTCQAPPGTGGAVADVVLRNANGQATLAGAYRYHTVPTLAAVTPARGSSAVPSSVTLTGSGFTADDAGTNSVTFGAVAATDVVVLDDGTLTCTVAPAPSGSVVDVALANANGVAVRTAGFAFDAPVPELTGVSPASGLSLGGTSVILSGSGFLDFSAGTNTVTFGGAAASNVVVLSDASLSCTTPTGTPGASVDVSLANANGSALLAGAFLYLAPPPTLLTVSPASGPAAGGGVVTLTGTGFLANGAGPNGVRIAGVPAAGVSVISDTTLTCTVPAGTGGVSVAVEVANANGTVQLAPGYRYHAVPTLSSTTPVDGTSLGGTLVTVHGSGFLADSPGPNVVRFGSSNATAVVVFDNNRLTCRAPSGAAGSIVNLTVTNANGSAQLTNAYRYHLKPTVTGVTPSSGTALGGNRVTVTGTGFTTDGAVVNIVSIGGITATSVTVISDTTIQCTAPAGTAGLVVQVTVANVNGTALLPGGYRYHQKPTVTAVAPATGPAPGATAVTLTGSGFQLDSAGTSSVLFGGVAATSVSVLGDTSLTCLTPPGSAGTVVDVVVSNANGSGTLLGGFTYDSVTVPIVASLTPTLGTTQGSTSVTLKGAGFTSDMTVEFGGTQAQDVTVLDGATLTCLTPARSGNDWVDVTVRGPEASSSLALGYKYVAAPTLTAVEPPTGDPSGGTLVVLNGAGFLEEGAGEVLVSFSGLAAQSTAVLDDEHISCEVPPGAALTDAEVEVTNTHGTARLARGYRWQRRLASDLDGDGRGDLVLSAPGDDALANNAGAVHVFYGTPLPLLDRSSAEADLTALPEGSASSFGLPVASGDLDGDGHSELLVAAPGDDVNARDGGSVYIFGGPLAASAAPLLPSQAETVLFSTRSNDRFGSALFLRDVDRNGVLDLLVGVPGRSPGAARLFLGSSAGLNTQPARILLGEFGNEGFATTLAAGDLDGDGWPDLVVGAPSAFGDLALSPTGKAWNPGEVRVFRGGPGPFAASERDPWLVFSGDQEGALFGSSVAVTDLTGDGIDDLVVGSPLYSTTGSQSGAVHVFLGGNGITGAAASAAAAVLSAEAAGDRFGASLSTGDIDGDGHADLLIGAPGHQSTGRAYLFRGASSVDSRSAAEADAILQSEPGAPCEFGSSVALVNVDGDAYEDMVVTAPGLDAQETDLGRVYVFRGCTVLAPRDAEVNEGTVTGVRQGDQLGKALNADH